MGVMTRFWGVGLKLVTNMVFAVETVYVRVLGREGDEECCATFVFER